MAMDFDWDSTVWLITNPLMDFIDMIDPEWFLFGFICGLVSSLVLAVLR